MLHGCCPSSLSSIEVDTPPVSSEIDGDPMVEQVVWASAAPGPALLSFIISSTVRASKGGLGRMVGVADVSVSLFQDAICMHARRAKRRRALIVQVKKKLTATPKVLIVKYRTRRLRFGATT